MFGGGAGDTLDLARVIGDIASGGIGGGGVLMAIIGLIKSLLANGNR
jgi:hypothetical protein